MQRKPPELDQPALNEIHRVAPQYHPIFDAWFSFVALFARILTFGRGRLIATGNRSPIHWDGVIR